MKRHEAITNDRFSADSLDHAQANEGGILDASTQFLAMLAHELRSPLGAISYTVEAMRHRPKDADADWAWELVGRQTEHMVRLVEDLMDVSRISQGKLIIRKVPAELGKLISQAIEAVRPQLISHRQQLIVSLPSQEVTLLADPVRLVEILTNLLNNAAKYTDEGGQIFLTAAEERGEVAIQVRDTGIGITAEMLPRIFDPFTQVAGALDRADGGIGIGLAMVARLVGLHGGTAQAFSDGLGCGSRFVIRLPLLVSLQMEKVAAGSPDYAAAEANSVAVEMSDEPFQPHELHLCAATSGRRISGNILHGP
jgi:signal transduction histidine kinase